MELYAAIQSIIDNKVLMIEQLHEFCSINSGTENIDGLAKMRQTLQHAFKPLTRHITIHRVPVINTVNIQGETTQKSYGELLYVRKRPDLKRRVLLAGHMDTVYDIHHPFQSLTYRNDNEIIGPGVADMKGGLIVMLHALQAFEQMSCADTLGWDVLINADEEVGSPASSILFADIASCVQAALIYEPAMTRDGLFAKNRKGSGKLTLVATGRSAHAGRAFHDGRNAICFLADIIHDIHALNGIRDGVTVNVGRFSGGDALNVVPDKAVAQLDIRIEKTEDEHWVRQQLDAISLKFKHVDYTFHIYGSFERPIKQVNKQTIKLFQRIQDISLKMGIRCDWQDSGGCCDGNNFSRLGLPVIDTLGVRGGEIHSSNEFIVLDSLVERASLSAMLLADLAQGGLEELTQS